MRIRFKLVKQLMITLIHELQPKNYLLIKVDYFSVVPRRQSFGSSKFSIDDLFLFF
jgi:hypothetical protein